MERFVRQMIMILAVFLGTLLNGSVWGQVFDSNIPNGYAKITLIAGDVWGDNTGYQMLIDANANTYGSTIPETGGLTSSGDASASTYAEFEYKIPTNADGSLSTSNIVFEDEISILIPNGTYDWCITNPTPGDRMWIASSGGNTNARQDDFIFENQYHYIFTITLGNDGHDRTDLNLPPKPREQCQVGDNWGNETFGYLPSYSLYEYSLTEQIYTPEEIGNSGIIGRISFYNTTNDISYYTRYLNIYLVHTNKDEFVDNTDWISATDNNLVFSGEVTMNLNDWTEIILDNTFDYNGIDNLALIINDTYGEWHSTMNYKVYASSKNQSLYVYQDGSAYSVINPTYTGHLSNKKNQIKLCTEEGWTLPITLLYFNATARSDGTNILKWATGYEEANSNFEIYRTNNILFGNWTHVATLWQGQPDKPRGANYQYLDVEPYDTTYYLLVQNDLDGNFETFRSEYVVCIQDNLKSKRIEPYVTVDNAINIINTDALCDVYVYYANGGLRFQKRMYPNETKRLDIRGFYMVEFIWVEDGDIQRKVEKVVNY